MKPLDYAHALGANQAYDDFMKTAGKEVAVKAIRDQIIKVLRKGTPAAVDEAAEIARLGIRTGQLTEAGINSMLKGTKGKDMGSLGEQLRIVMAHGKEKALIDPVAAHSWAKAQGKSVEGLPPIYGQGGGAPATTAPAAAAPKPPARPAVTRSAAPPPEPVSPVAPPPVPPSSPVAPAAAAAPSRPRMTPGKGAILGATLGTAAGIGAGAGLGAGYYMGKESASLGDPLYWQGGTPDPAQEAPPEAPASAEDAALSLPTGVFQGLQMKINPMGERSTTVKVTPDALGTPDILSGIFSAEPATKVEISVPQAKDQGGQGGPADGGVPQGPPLDGAGAAPPPQMEGLPPAVGAKVAELLAGMRR
ncbi:hypothetical protein KJ782_06990 [Patescibacteria group bacterium]|nr:hypothetical protein [Patescibacteria group bacterium]